MSSESKSSLKSIMEMIDARISHIEDMVADNRATIIKLAKQGNKIVKFLSRLEVEEISEDIDDLSIQSLTPEEEARLSKFTHIKDILDEYMDKHKELKEFEEELRKYKGQLTPGQFGES